MRTLSVSARVLCVVFLLAQLPLVYAQEGESEQGMSGGPRLTEYTVQHKDGTVENGWFLKRVSYYLKPGWSKPRRVITRQGPSGEFKSSFATRSAQARPDNTANTGRYRPVDILMAPGDINIDVLVLAKAEGQRTSQVIVGRIATGGVLNPEFEMGGGMGGMMGGGGMAGGMPGGMGGAMGGYGSEGSAMGGGMGAGMAGMGMEGSEGGMGMGEPGPVTIVPLDETRYLPSTDRSSQLSVAQLKTVTELVRVDCSIEEELDNLRKARRDADEFKKAESSLKELLARSMNCN